MRILGITLLALFMVGCESKIENLDPEQKPVTPSPVDSKITGHDPAGCPDLKGIYVPTEGGGTHFHFETADGVLRMSSRKANGFEFKNPILMNGNKQGAEDASTVLGRCGGKRAVVVFTDAAGTAMTVVFTGDAEKMKRTIFNGDEVKESSYLKKRD